MKKLFYAFCMLLMSTAAFAQLPDGATAPDFTYNDLDGKEWNLYEILETGRPVIIDISATWCGPCWSYHQAGTLEDLYAQHGPEGDNQLMVLWLEGDGDTNEACIYGPTGCVGGTAGDWTAGVDFPLIDDARVFSLYNGAYYPTLYTIFPDDKTLVESGQLGFAPYMNIISPRVGDVKDNLVKLKKMSSNSFSQQICAPQSAVPAIGLRNMGKEHLTSITFELQWNGEVMQTIDWTGDAKVFDDIEVTFDQLMVDGAGSLAVVAKAPNGDMTADDQEVAVDYTGPISANTGDMLTFNMLTDAGGAYMYWAMLDADGVIMHEGGNKAVGLDGGGQYAGVAAPADADAYGVFKNITETLSVPTDGSCYSIVVVDGAGDGFSGPGRYRLANPGMGYFFTMTEDFTSSIAHTFGQSTVGTDIPEVAADLALFPNPASDVIAVDFTLTEAADLNISVTNTIGQTVQTIAAQNYPNGQNQITLSVKDLPNGLYFLNLKSATGARSVQQFAVVK